MRKSAGLIFALLLLTVPALANAWTLTVKVNGGSTGTNYATVSTTTKQQTGGTAYYYPTGSVTVTAVGPGAGTISSTRGTASGTPKSITLPAGANATVTVTYAAATKFNVGITQTAGGTISMQLPNGAYSTTGATGVTDGTSLPLTVAAASDYKIDSVTVNGAAVNGVSNGTKGQVAAVPFTATLGAANTITAAFSKVITSTLSLSAPTVGYTSKPVVVTASLATNGAPASSYTFTITGVTNTATVTGNQVSFVPSTTGNAHIVATAVGNGATATADIAINSYAAFANSQCTSCHSSSTPAIVDNYNASAHATNAHSACDSCHSAGTTDAHTSGINLTTVDKATFVVITSNTAETDLSKGQSFCTKCHTGPYPIPHPITGLTKTCSACHAKGGDVHQITTAFAILKAKQGASCTECHTRTLPPHPKLV